MYTDQSCARVQAGGPSYAVELGRLDGLSSTASSVNGKLAPPSFDLDQLTALFATNGLSQTDMIALSGNYQRLFPPSLRVLTVVHLDPSFRLYTTRQTYYK
jgi:hypothetical protein